MALSIESSRLRRIGPPIAWIGRSKWFRRILTTVGLLFAAVASLYLGLVVVGITVIQYRFFENSYAVLDPSPHPRWSYKNLITPGAGEPWREYQGLPPRFRVLWSYEEDSWSRLLYRTPDWSLWIEDGISSPEEWDRIARWMLQTREGLVLTAPDASRPMVVSGVSGAAVAIWCFLLVAGCIRVWGDIACFGVGRDVGRLAMMTAVALGAVSTFPRMMFSIWVLHTPPFSARYGFPAVVWEPWSMMQDILWDHRTPAAWSVALGIVAVAVWALTSLTLRVAATTRPGYGPLAERFARVALWAVPVLVLQYIVLSTLVGDALTPVNLCGNVRGWM